MANYLLHIAFFATYSGIAYGVSALLPGGMRVTQVEAMIVGGFIFVLGVIVQEILARSVVTLRLESALKKTQAGNRLLQDELAWTRKEIWSIREALEAAAETGKVDAAQQAVDEVTSEVKVLKSLIAKLAPEASARVRRAEKTMAEVKVAEERPAPEAPARPTVISLEEHHVLEMVREALRDDRIDIALQPVVTLPQRRKAYYECLSRIRTADGSVIGPERYISVAEREGLIAAIDNMLLFRCIQIIRKIQRKQASLGFFCNISPYTLRDSEFFGDFVEFMENNPDLAKNLIFEFTQANFRNHGAAEVTNLLRLAMLGCSFSIDGVEDLDFDPEDLASRHIRYVKIDSRLLVGRRGAGLAQLAEGLETAGVELICSHIETEAQLVELLDHDLKLGQGFLFGEPRNVKQERQAS